MPKHPLERPPDQELKTGFWSCRTLSVYLLEASHLICRPHFPHSNMQTEHDGSSRPEIMELTFYIWVLFSLSDFFPDSALLKECFDTA